MVNEAAKVVGTRKEAQAAVDCTLLTITKALKKKDTASLVGFGTFKIERGKAWNVPKSVPGKALKDAE